MILKTSNNYLDKPAFGILKARAVKGGGANIIAEIVSFLIRTGGVIILARLVQPRDFGLVTMVAMFYMLVMNFGINGFTEFTIQKDTIDHSELSNIFWVHAVISAVLTSIFIAAGPLLAAFYKQPELRSISAVMASGIMIQMLATHHLAVMNRRMEFGKIAINRVIAALVSTGVAILMAANGMGYWAIVARQLSTVFVVGIGAWIMCPWRPSMPTRPYVVSGSLKYAVHVYFNYVLSNLSRTLDKILLGRFHGSELLGYYDRAYYLSAMPVDQLVTPLHGVGLATLSRLRNDRSRYENYFTKAFSTLSLVGVLASTILTLNGKDIIIIVLGPGWQKAGSVMSAFGPGIAAMMLYYAISWIHLSLDRPDRLSRWGLFSLLIIVGALAITAPLGAVYVAGAYSLLYNLLLFPALWYAGRPIALRVFSIGKSIWRFFAAGAFTCFIGLMFVHFFPATRIFFVGLEPIVRLSLVLPSSILLYSGLVVALHWSLDPISSLFSLARILVTRELPTSSVLDRPKS